MCVCGVYIELLLQNRTPKRAARNRRAAQTLGAWLNERIGFADKSF